jgi:tetratricopeptide (TPR) repeat protein
MSEYVESRYQRAQAAMAQGDLEGAVQLFQEDAVELPHFKTLELLGECLMRLGRTNEAIVPLAAATTLNRGVRAPSLLAEALLATGNLTAAVEAADLALQRDPKNRKALEVRQSAGAPASPELS